MNLEGKVAIVTGGGTGIGKGAAMALAEKGARVIVTGRRSGPLEETVAEIEQKGGIALACPGDVTVRADIEKTRDLIKSEWGRLDILVNNAGSALRKPFLETTVDEFDHLYRIDLRSVFEVSQVMVPLMQESGGGSIINISSILGVLGAYQSTAYCAMKGGVVNLTRLWQQTWAPQSGLIVFVLPILLHLCYKAKLTAWRRPGKWIG